MANELAIIAKKAGITFLPDNKTHMCRFRVPSSSSDNTYIVALNKKTMEWGCECRGWIMKKPGKPRNCQHLEGLRPALIAIAAVVARNQIG